MNKKIIIGVTGVILVGIVGYFFVKNNTKVSTTQTENKTEISGHDMNTMTNTEDHSNIMNMSRAVVDGTNRISIENISKLTAGKTVFKFKITGLNGKEITDTDLKISHEKKMHFLVIRNDVTTFEHLHPEYVNGFWNVSAVNLNNGDYNLYVDISPIDEVESTLKVTAVVGSKTANKLFPKLSVSGVAKVGDYAVELLEKELEATENHPLNFKVTKNGSGVANIMPYLGAYGHVIMVDHNNSNNFVHAHPSSEAAPTNSQIAFSTVFPNEGNYTIFAQFNIGGEIKVFPITINVKKSGEAKHSDANSVIDESKPHGH